MQHSLDARRCIPPPFLTHTFSHRTCRCQCSTNILLAWLLTQGNNLSICTWKDIEIEKKLSINKNGTITWPHFIVPRACCNFNFLLNNAVPIVQMHREKIFWNWNQTAKSLCYAAVKIYTTKHLFGFIESLRNEVTRKQGQNWGGFLSITLAKHTCCRNTVNKAATYQSVWSFSPEKRLNKVCSSSSSRVSCSK